MKSNFKNYLLPPTITGGLPPSDPGSPGTTGVTEEWTANLANKTITTS